MDEYIKREDALDAVLFALVGTGCQTNAIFAIRDIPAADVVEVVRCKDCKHWSYAQSINRHECNIFNGAYNFIGYPTQENDFCSYGERKE